MLGTTWGWLLAGVCALAQPPQESPETVHLAVLPVSVHGDAAGLTGEALQERIVAGLASTRFEIQPSALGEGLAECDSRSCRDRTAAMSGVTHWLAIDLRGRDRTYEATLRLYAVGEREPVMEASDRCVICGRAELDDLVAAQAVVVRDWLEQREAATGRLHVEARPAGALVFVDGEPAGRTPATINVEPGRHRVEISARNHHSVSKTLTVGRGVTEHVEADLDRQQMRLWPWGAGALAAGVPMLASGAVLLALDGRHYGPRCGDAQPGNFDADGDCRYVHDTFVPGVALTVVGALGTVAGVTLVTVDAVRGTRGASLRATVGPGRVGLAGRF